MKESDLRIGNWIQWYGEPMRVDANDFVNGIGEAEPIPLTEEWLFKFGFEKHESLILDSYSIKLPMIGHKQLTVTIALGNQYMSIKDFDTDDYKSIPTDMCVLRNSDSHGRFMVHDTQNLYHALTNQELTI